MIRDVYLDNHATTRTDPRVVEAMLPWMLEDYANPGSVTHDFGRRVADHVATCTARIAGRLGAESDELVFTSGATESVNLALFGIALHPRQKRRRIVSAATEHRAALDPLRRLEKQGFEVVRLRLETSDPGQIGCVDLDHAAQVIDGNTALVSLMLGNNEIGSLQPLGEVASLCRRHGVVLHTDATQAVGKIPVNVAELGVDLVSFSAHKFYGPKGVGGLIVRAHGGELRLQPQILGGGQQRNLRSGTLNSVGIAGMDRALEIAIQVMPDESLHCMRLRELLWKRLQERIHGLQLNGPDWNRNHGMPGNRLPGNLNLCFPRVDGQSLMLRAPRLAVSSGSACTSAEPHPSHVLQAIGRTEDEARSSLRFGIGRFTTEEEIEMAAEWLSDAYTELVEFVA